MKLKATALQERVGPTGNVYMDGRYEIQWEDGGPWLSFGLSSFTIEEWLLLGSLVMLGARNSNVDFEYVALPETVCQQ